MLKRSRCKNSSYRKFVLKKTQNQTTKKPHTTHKKKRHTQTPKHKRNPHTYAKKSKPAPFQVFYTTRSITSTGVLATLPTESDYVQYSEKDTANYFMQWLFKRNYLSHHTYAVPQENTSQASLQKNWYKLNKLHLLHSPQTTERQYISYQFANGRSFKICAPHQKI